MIQSLSPQKLSQKQVFWKILRGRLIFAACLMAACFVFTHWILPLIHQPTSEFILTEADERQLLRLRKNLDSGTVRALKIRIRGHLNGTAMIRLFDAQDPVKIHQDKIIGSGKIDARMGGDWTANDSRIEYEPLSATNGSLKIEYVFDT